jgi:hypothetical protein
MFIFQRTFQAVGAGLGVALLMVCLDRACQPTESPATMARGADPTARLVRRAPLGVSSAPVRDLSLSCRLPPASFASWLPSLKSRIVPDQVAVCAPINRCDLGMRSC